MNQSGYALLLSLFVTLGVGGFWFASSNLHNAQNSRDQTAELERARHALISYAVNYIDHYGAQGAGVGHLPCPDTDSPNQEHSDPWVRDGPNPPCGRAAVEHGWLPRHVNTINGRYHFHTRSRQRLWYAVSGSFINNPLNRIVSSETNGNISIGRFNDIVAVITSPPLDTSTDNSYAWWDVVNAESTPAAYAIIRTKDIITPAMQRVADWLLTRLNAALIERCSAGEANDQCNHGIYAVTTCDLSSENKLFQWLSVSAPNTNCISRKNDLLDEFTLFEGVPFRRHWFVRNGWSAFVEFHVTNMCINLTNSDCEFVAQVIKSDDQTISFTLQPRTVDSGS